MFRIMIPHDQRLENLLILLGDNDHIATAESSSVLNLPTYIIWDFITAFLLFEGSFLRRVKNIENFKKKFNTGWLSYN